MNTEIEKLRKEIEVLKRTLQPIGSIQCFATQDVPDCWLPCDGRELMTRMYPELYQKIGNVFGGVPNKTFCLPDLQGRFIRGWDKEWNLDSGRKFGSTQEDAFQGHGHKVLPQGGSTGYDGSHTHRVYYTVYKVGSNFGENDMPVYEIPTAKSERESFDPGTTVNGWHNHSLPIISAFEPTSCSYGKIRVAIETRPKNLALLYCIKVK